MISYQNLKNLLFKLDPENAHSLAEFGMRFAGSFAPSLLNPVAARCVVANARLEQELFGVNFPNPIGVGAGFDKNATMIKALSALGFGYVEYGTVTPKPQNGNDKPRLWRHIEEESLQNAMGFNNEGKEAVSKRVAKLYPYVTPLGANIGKNKITSQDDALRDYEEGVKSFSPFCDYLAINISSPNTPNLRDLQNEQFIEELFTSCVKLTNKPILLKLSPDMSETTAVDLARVAVRNGAKGIIATNTSVDYSLVSNPQDKGGISGKVIKEKSFAIFEAIAKEFYGKTVLISVGGISDANDVYKRLKAGASLAQLFTSFIYEGPTVNRNINRGLLEIMDAEGFYSIKEVIGLDRK